MPVIKKSPEEIKADFSKNELKKLNEVTPVRIDQIEKASAEAEESSKLELEKMESSTETETSGRSRKYSDVIMARLSKGKRNIFKAFFSENGITMNSGIEMCIEYVMDQVREGNLKISKAGIK